MASLDDIKLPPHDIEAEKSTISSAMLDNEIMYLYDSINLAPADFYEPAHQQIFQAIKDLYNSKRSIDAITVVDRLKKNEALEHIGENYIYELSTFALTSSSGFDHAKIVKEKSVLRNIIKACQSIIGEAYSQKDFMDILEQVEKKVFDLTQVQMTDSLVHIKEILNMRVDQIMEAVDDPSILDKWKILSNYTQLDDLMNWFKPWDLAILAARPSMWKTAFVLNLVANASIRQKKSVAVFSLEMWNDQIVDRIMSLVAEIPLTKIHKWLLDENDFASMWSAMEKIWDTDIFIDDRGWSLPEIKSKLRKLKIQKWRLDLVVIDYLQLISWTGSKFGWNRVQEISEISRWLKELARELQVPIIALSQLSRAVESRPDKVPQLSDLRESGSIEQDADSVLMLYREDYYDPDTDKKWIASIYIRKNRNGPTGEVELMFMKNIMKFYNQAVEENR